MILALCLSLIQTSVPQTYAELSDRMREAHQSLENYTDTWDLTDEFAPDRIVRFRRTIDGHRSTISISTLRPGEGLAQEQPALVEGQNGREEFIVSFATKSYYVGKDTGKPLDVTGIPAGSGRLRAVVRSDFVGFEGLAWTLKGITRIPGEIARGRVATAEAKDGLMQDALVISMFNRWWLPTDIEATIEFAGKPKTIRLHGETIMMNAKLARHVFDFDKAWIKDFTKRTREEMLSATTD